MSLTPAKLSRVELSRVEPTNTTYTYTLYIIQAWLLQNVGGMFSILFSSLLCTPSSSTSSSPSSYSSLFSYIYKYTEYSIKRQPTLVYLIHSLFSYSRVHLKSRSRYLVIPCFPGTCAQEIKHALYARVIRKTEQRIQRILCTPKS